MFNLKFNFLYFLLDQLILLQTFIEIPGDVMIGGIFNVHDADDVSPFQCSDIKIREGFQYTEALRYAISLVNKVSMRHGILDRNQNLLHCSSNSLY